MALPVSGPASLPLAGIALAADTRHGVGAYLGLTKTRIIEQLLVVTVPAMFLAQRGMPSVGSCSPRCWAGRWRRRARTR